MLKNKWKRLKGFLGSILTRKAEKERVAVQQHSFASSLLGETSTKPIVVKKLIPRSYFTKRGPGVEAEARAAFREMTQGQRLVAVGRGWLPRHWLRTRKAKNKSVSIS